MIYFLDKLVPISRNISWVENTNVAYYNWLTGIEEALYSMSWSNPWFESWQTFNPTTTSTWYSFQITASGKQLPSTWQWNSPFDTNWNRIWIWEPLQLVVTSWMDWGNVVFNFKVPNLWSWSSLTLSWWTWAIINWSLAWSGTILFASGSQITASGWEIWNSSTSWNDITLGWKAWLTIEWISKTLNVFYNDLWSYCNWYKCTLKLSIINPLISTTWEEIPFLEYKISFNWTNPATPLQYAIINADGYSYWYKRSIRKEIRQLTTAEAFDFTVFQ